MLKMRANFIGLHSYNFNELTNWIGPASAILPNGSVTGAVPGASFATAGGGTHFVGPKTTPFPTSSYYFGAAALFDTDCFCGNAEVVHGDACPIAATSESAARAFDRAGAFQAEVFKLARSLGIHTATGVELPVVPVAAWPNATSAGVFEGILTRLVNLQTPSEYFWLWTSESWEWCENSPFSQFPYGKKPIIYQDRVGTDTRKTPNLAVVPQGPGQRHRPEGGGGAAGVRGPGGGESQARLSLQAGDRSAPAPCI